LEKMGDIENGSIDMVLADPPYGTTACKWDSIIPLEPMWEHLKRVIKPNGAIVMTASQPFTTKLIGSNLKMFRHEWIWHKNSSGGFATAKFQPMKYHENVLVFARGKTTYNPIFEEYAASVKKSFKEGASIKSASSVAKTNKIHNGFGGAPHSISFNRGKYPSSVQKISGVPNCNGARLHPTQKPVALMEYLIKTYTNEGETVLDFTMGSGTTGVACKNLNRSFVGIEMDDHYFQVASDRINQQSNQCQQP
jgi:site-specific DNA-methyltransferase (adenine-specific)